MKKKWTLKKGECPACGRMVMHEDEAMNALSRNCDAYICSDCGVTEAFNGFFWKASAIVYGFISVPLTKAKG